MDQNEKHKILKSEKSENGIDFSSAHDEMMGENMLQTQKIPEEEHPHSEDGREFEFSFFAQQSFLCESQPTQEIKLNSPSTINIVGKTGVGESNIVEAEPLSDGTPATCSLLSNKSEGTSTTQPLENDNNIEQRDLEANAAKSPYIQLNSCKMCKFVFRNLGNVSPIMIAKHFVRNTAPGSKETFQCKLCTKVLHLKYYADKHMLEHVIHGEVTCMECICKGFGITEDTNLPNIKIKMSRIIFTADEIVKFSMIPTFCKKCASELNGSAILMVRPGYMETKQNISTGEYIQRFYICGLCGNAKPERGVFIKHICEDLSTKEIYCGECQPLLS